MCRARGGAAAECGGVFRVLFSAFGPVSGAGGVGTPPPGWDLLCISNAVCKGRGLPGLQDFACYYFFLIEGFEDQVARGVIGPVDALRISQGFLALGRYGLSPPAFP